MDGFESVSIHLFDGSDPNFVNLYASDNGRYINHMTTYKKLVSFGAPASDTISWIKQQIGPNKIHIMRIVAHGDSGAFFLGKVYSEYTAYDWWTLRGSFDSAARIELHSCAIASDVSLHDDMRNPGNKIKRGKFSGSKTGKGYRFMRNLAAAVNVKVVASIDDHLVSSNTWSISSSVTVYPNGDIATQALNPMVPD